MRWHEANAKNARLLFVARAILRRIHYYACICIALRLLHSRARLALRTPAFVTRVTESKVECYRPCEQALYSRFCSLFADEYCSTHSCGTRRRYVRSRIFPLRLARLVPVSIAKARVVYSLRSEIEVICTHVRGIYESLSRF